MVIPATLTGMKVGSSRYTIVLSIHLRLNRPYMKSIVNIVTWAYMHSRILVVSSIHLTRNRFMPQVTHVPQVPSTGPGVAKGRQRKAVPWTVTALDHGIDAAMVNCRHQLIERWTIMVTILNP